MDSSVVKLPAIPGCPKQLYLLSTTDFFYPLVDDPYIQGRIACANVLSDLYAMGCSEVATVLMMLGVAIPMSANERDVVTTLLIKGFSDAAEEAGTSVTGGQTVLNPWVIVGGVAKAVCSEEQFVRPDAAVPGDVLVLTKPLGTQVAVNLLQWARGDKWSRVESVVTREQLAGAMCTATESMARLNRHAAKAMTDHGAHAATDVTGFGLLGHATNLAKSQKAPVHLRIHTLPIIRHMAEADAAYKRATASGSSPGRNFRLVEGHSAETSGGLLVCMPKDRADAFVKAVSEADGQPAWIVGEVLEAATAGDGAGAAGAGESDVLAVGASIADGVKVVDV